MSGSVVSIHVGAEKAEAMSTTTSAELVAGKGVAGDRYFNQRGTYSKKHGPDREVTLIEEEALIAAERDYGVVVTGADTRRNIVTRGVALNHLVGKTFKLGAATLEGIKLCEPCGHLAKLLANDRVREALVHRGGLRCRVVDGAVVKVGDAVD
jgi:MOSC domain-containing protein YiiM